MADDIPEFDDYDEKVPAKTQDQYYQIMRIVENSTTIMSPNSKILD